MGQAAQPSNFIYYLYFQCVALLVVILSAVQTKQTPWQQNFECENVHDRCVFIVSTGRSGSTALMGAMNQIENVFIRGENGGMFLTLESFYNQVQSLSGKKQNPQDAKNMYERYIRREKPAWFSSFPYQTAKCLAKDIFKKLYGYGKYSDYIVGFKEIRYQVTSQPVKEFEQEHIPYKWYYTHMDTYTNFANRINFLNNLCNRTQIVLNLRRNVTATAHSDFYLKKSNASDIVSQLSGWLEKYHQENLETSFVVYYEDMFDGQVNETLAKDLLGFLRVDFTNITFASVLPKK
eukprot:TRINITY_DN8120_c0_g3_i2.p1 TRINITY_DN8120_c0_g3~~TRINITY_DN8120_c0_g3_i2.p1  ORF type:complete len:292 (-),score=10.76 TRINITY_DN8120_c0_g3_i2:2659-3534(-)